MKLRGVVPFIIILTGCGAPALVGGFLGGVGGFYAPILAIYTDCLPTQIPLSDGACVTGIKINGKKVDVNAISDVNKD